MKNFCTFVITLSELENHWRSLLWVKC